MATGDVTYSSYGDGTLQAFASGSYEIDASEGVNIYCGFQPRRIEIYNITTDDLNHVWFTGIASGLAIQTVPSTGACTVLASGGPTVLNNSTGEGFTIPAGLLTTDDDVLYWVAWR